MRNQITQIRPHSWITQIQLSRITQIRAARKNGSRRSVLRLLPDHADPGIYRITQIRSDHADPLLDLADPTLQSQITQIRNQHVHVQRQDRADPIAHADPCDVCPGVPASSASHRHTAAKQLHLAGTRRVLYIYIYIFFPFYQDSMLQFFRTR